MLSAAEQYEIEEAMRQHDRREAVLPDALLIVQRHRGWVADDAIAAVADFLSLSREEVDAVATFYSRIYRQPVGRHVILLCDSVSCWIMGATTLYAHCKTRLGISFGETTADGRFTLLPTVCLGACDRAPVMMIDNDLHGELTPERVDDILRSYA